MVNYNGPEVVLASASPRRAELLKNIGLQFRVVPSDVCEEDIIAEDPANIVRKLALEKARSVAEREPQAIVIGSDTIVVRDGKTLGKPTNRDEAAAMLRTLSGRAHQVMTGLAVVSPFPAWSEEAIEEGALLLSLAAGGEGARSQVLVTHEVTSVSFRPLAEEEISRYVATGEPMDKAGAYGIQGKAGVFVTGISGCYFNVVGLPLAKVALVLRSLGIRLP